MLISPAAIRSVNLCQSWNAFLRYNGVVKIEIEALTVILGNAPVLQNLSILVPEGAAVAIVGQSGTGKTTLLRAIAGLIAPSGGRILIGGNPPEALYGSAKLAFLFQEAYLWQHLTVRQNLQLVYNVHNLQVNIEHVNRQLETVGLSAAADLFPFQLSVGMKARAAIARALCLPPKFF